MPNCSRSAGCDPWCSGASSYRPKCSFLTYARACSDFASLTVKRKPWSCTSQNATGPLVAFPLPPSRNVSEPSSVVSIRDASVTP